MKCQAVLLCVLALYLHHGEAITCHICTSPKDQRCEDHFNITMKGAECSDTTSNVLPCIKTITIEKGQKFTNRSCGVANTEVCSSLKKRSDITVKFCGECFSDDCNGSSGVLPSTLLMLVATFAVFMAVLKQ